MSKPNPFLTGFVYVLIAILSISIIYSCIGKIDIYSKAVGYIRPNDEVSTVSSLLSGKITEVNAVDGQFVKEGDVLYKVDSTFRWEEMWKNTRDAPCSTASAPCSTFWQPCC